MLEELRIASTSEFEDLFAKTTTTTKKKPLSEAYEKKAKARKVRNQLQCDVKSNSVLGNLIFFPFQ